MATASSLAGRGRKNAFDSVATGSTDSNLVSAVAGKKIRVIAFLINHGDTTAAAVTFNTKPAGAGSAIFPALKYGANGGTSVPECSTGYFETNVGEGLTVTTGGTASTTAIAVVYELVS